MVSNKTKQPADVVRKCIHDLARIYQEDPFQFIDEKGLHRTFADLFKKKNPESEFELKIEYPVPVKGTEYGSGRVKQKRTAQIDIVLTLPDSNMTRTAVMGVEMDLARGHDAGEVQIGDRNYSIRKSKISPQDSLLHLEKDTWKLQKVTPNSYFLVYFFSHSFSNRSSTGRQAGRAKRIDAFTDQLRRYGAVDQDRLIIVEALFLNGKPTSRHALNLPELISNIP